MKVLKDGDLVTLNGRKGMVGTVRGSSIRSGDDPDVGEMLSKNRGDDLYWINQEATMLCGDPGYYEQEKARWSKAIALKDGEIVELEGQKMKVGWKGNYSTMAFLKPIPKPDEVREVAHMRYMGDVPIGVAASDGHYYHTWCLAGINRDAVKAGKDEIQVVQVYYGAERGTKCAKCSGDLDTWKDAPREQVKPHRVSGRRCSRRVTPRLTR